MAIGNLSLGLQHGAELNVLWEDDQDTVRIDRRQIGTLHLPSGRLLACDQSVLLRSPERLKECSIEFSPTLRPRGEYRFDVSIACFGPSDPRQHPQFQNFPPQFVEQIFREHEPHGGDQRIALAVLLISDLCPVRWEIASSAARPGENAGDRADFPVDVGSACYLDAAAAESLVTHPDDSLFSQITAEIERQFLESYQDTRGWANVVLRDMQANLIVCSTGFGSGSFPSYWGLDTSGSPVCLVTDFGILTSCEIPNSTTRVDPRFGE